MGDEIDLVPCSRAGSGLDVEGGMEAQASHLDVTEVERGAVDVFHYSFQSQFSASVVSKSCGLDILPKIVHIDTIYPPNDGPYPVAYESILPEHQVCALEATELYA